MSQESRTQFERRVREAAETALSRGDSVSAVEMMNRLGWLPGPRLDAWRQGRLEYLEQALSVRPAKLAQALEIFRRWAEEKGLRPTETPYVAATRDRRPLRCTADGDEAAERFYRTQWVSPELSDARRERLIAKRGKAPDLNVIMADKEWTCAGCHGTGDLLILEEGRRHCLTCADMDHLVFLPAGNTALTRRARQESTLSAVVVRWNRNRKRYERKGLLVEEAGLERAEEQCLADEDVRARRRERDQERRAAADVELRARMAAEILRLFPGCPAERAEAIAEHTGLRGSGRVGRSAAGRALDADALARAVAASVRHEDTDYDQLLMSGVPRDEARTTVKNTVSVILEGWRNGEA